MRKTPPTPAPSQLRPGHRSPETRHPAMQQVCAGTTRSPPRVEMGGLYDPLASTSWRPRTWGDERDWRASVCTRPTPPPAPFLAPPRAPPGPGTPARIPARVVSPGPLSHVRWQSIPSCLHSSAVKTATSGLGPARTPRVWERACWRGAQGHTWGHPPLCACAPSESICTRMSVCAGVPGSADMHERRKLTGPRGSPDP